MSQQELAALCLRLNRLVVESELEVAELEHRLADVTERGRDLLDKFTTRVRQLQRLKQQYDETKHKVTQLAGLEDDVLALRKQVAELERALRTAKTVPSSATASEESSDSSTVESLSIRAELLRAHNVTLEDQLRRVKQQQHEKDQTIAQLHGDLKRVQQSVAEQLIVKDEVIQKLEHTIDEYVLT
jgi:predicted  nucleic acid-binding Zn-ribbon protein